MIGDEETDDPHTANDRNFYKVELWAVDGQHVERMLYAGNRLDKAQAAFEAFAKKRPGARLMIRQRGRVLQHRP